MKVNFLIGALFISVNVHADIYKCMNKEGLTIFKDSPCGKADKLKKILKPQSNYDKSLDYKITIDNQGPLGKNLLLNSSFENKLVDWRVPLGAYWSNNAGVKKSGALVIQAKEPPKNRAIYRTKVQQCVTLGVGEKFGLYAKFRYSKKPKNKHANRANVVWYDSPDCTIGGQYGSYIEPKTNTSGWQELGHGTLTPALGAKSAQITIFQNGRYSEGGQGIWDDIVFTATQIHQYTDSAQSAPLSKNQYTLPIGENYLLNNSFDRNIKSWRADKFVSWVSKLGGERPGAIKVDAFSKKGSRGSDGFSQCVNIGNNKNFELGASFKRESNSSQKGGARLRLTWFEGENCTGRIKAGQNHRNPKDIDGWQKLRIEGLRVLFNAQSAQIEVVKVVSGKGRFTAYWDDFYFKAVK